MKQTTQIGATVKEAISLALQNLGHTREQVDVEVLQEGKKGFLGFGSRPAKVRVTVKESVQPEVNEEVIIAQEAEQPSEKGAVAALEVDESFGEEPVHANEDQPIHQEEQQEDPVEAAKAYLTSIATEMGITDLHIEQKNEGKYISFRLESEKAALLIGKRGQTLNALQQLTQLVLNKSAKSFMLVKSM